MRKASLIAILAIPFAGAFQLRASDPMLPVMATDLSVSLRDAFLLASGFALPMGAMQILLGPTADAIGKVRVIRVAIVLLTLFTILSALAPGYGSLMAARVLTGAAAGGIIPMTMALMADTVPPAGRQAAFGRVMAAATIGQILGAALAGTIVGSYGWRAVYAMMAGMAALAVAVAFLLVERDMAQPRPISLRRAVGDYARILTSRGALLIAMTSVANGVFIVGLFPLLAPLLQERGGDGPFQAGLAIAAFAVGGFMLGIGVSWLAGRVRLPMLMRTGFVLTGLGYFAVSHTLPWPWIVALFVLIGFGFFMVQNSLLALITDLVPEARGSSVSILLLCLFTGQTLGPVVWGAVAEAAGFAQCFALTSVALVTLAIGIGPSLRRADLPRRTPTSPASGTPPR